MTSSTRLPSPTRNRNGEKSPSRSASSAASTDTAGTRRILADCLEPFADLEPLRERVLVVLSALPDEVRRDLLQDPRFRMTLDDFVPGEGRTVWLACPGPGGNGSRCVVLKPQLADCREAFAHYVIAHELAHAYLHNGGWGGIDDPEAAADAVAASWGFQKPAM